MSLQTTSAVPCGMAVWARMIGLKYAEGGEKSILPLKKIMSFSYRDAVPIAYDLVLLSVIVYAANLLYVIAHEMGHAILDTITGGTVLNVYINYFTVSGKTAFIGGDGIITGAGGLIAGGLLSILLYKSGTWSTQLAAAIIAFRTMSECVLIMPGADITLLKGTFITPLILLIVFACGYITYAGALKGLGRNVNIAYAVGVAAVAASVTAAYLLV